MTTELNNTETIQRAFADAATEEKAAFVAWLCGKYRTLLCKTIVNSDMCPLVKGYTEESKERGKE